MSISSLSQTLQSCYLFYKGEMSDIKSLKRQNDLSSHYVLCNVNFTHIKFTVIISTRIKSSAKLAYSHSLHFLEISLFFLCLQINWEGNVNFSVTIETGSQSYSFKVMILGDKRRKVKIGYDVLRFDVLKIGSQQEFIVSS